MRAESQLPPLKTKTALPLGAYAHVKRVLTYQVWIGDRAVANAVVQRSTHPGTAKGAGGRPHRLPYAWLGVGALTLGVGPHWREPEQPTPMALRLRPRPRRGPPPRLQRCVALPGPQQPV